MGDLAKPFSNKSQENFLFVFCCNKTTIDYISNPKIGFDRR